LLFGTSGSLPLSAVAAASPTRNRGPGEESIVSRSGSIRLEARHRRYQVLIPPPDVSPIAFLGYCLVAGAEDHLGLMRQHLSLLGRRGVLHHLCQGLHLTDVDSRKPTARLANLVEGPVHDPFIAQARLDEPDVTRLVAMNLAPDITE
jgi:hypothetical protein